VSTPTVESPAARLSVILPAERPETLRRMRDALRAQTARAALEIVVVRWPGAWSDWPELDDDGYAAVRVVDVAEGTALPAGRAAGTRVATSALVFFAETHAYPSPGWAEAVLRAAASGRWQVVASSFRNANPDGPVSWAGFILDYGSYDEALGAGEIDTAPMHKGTFRRDDLLAFGDRLPAVLSAGDELPLGLRAQGRRVYFEPAARIAHLNAPDLRLWLRGRYLIGFLIGANRAERWPASRRALYAVLAPLIGPLLLWRAIPVARHVARAHPLPRGTWSAMALGAFARAAGESVAYALGPLPSLQARADEYELYESVLIGEATP